MSFYAFQDLQWLPNKPPLAGGSVGPNPHFTLAFYVLHAQKHHPQATKKRKKRESWWHFSPWWNQKGSSTSIISAKLKGKDEEGKNTHTHIHSSHHHLHSRFLKSSHISVTMATPPLSPSLFRSCVFFSSSFFFNPSHPPLLSLLSFVADSKYNCEPLRLALCSSSFGVPQKKKGLGSTESLGGEKKKAGLRSVPGGS